MEWGLDVNTMLPHEITRITDSLMPPGFVGDVRSIRAMQDSLSKVIDTLGELSAKEQGLNKVITSAAKLRSSDSYIIYIMKDPEANNGAGEAIGFLKMGSKHLFLFDDKQTVREVEPLCVLDFFVRKEYQRHGHGKALFDYMLQDLNVSAWQLAIDGPSAKMEAFMMKNYGISQLLRQSNNFAVSPHFFDNLLLQDDGKYASSATSEGGATRYSAPKPQSSIGNVIHGDGGSSSRTHHSKNRSLHDSTALCEEWVGERAAGEGVTRPSTLPVGPPSVDVGGVNGVPAGPALNTPTPAGAPSRREAHLNDKGFFDVKFHHEKLW